MYGDTLCIIWGWYLITGTEKTNAYLPSFFNFASGVYHLGRGVQEGSWPEMTFGFLLLLLFAFSFVCGLLYDHIKKCNFGEYCIWSISFRTWTTIMKVIPMTVPVLVEKMC